MSVLSKPSDSISTTNPLRSFKKNPQQRTNQNYNFCQNFVAFVYCRFIDNITHKKTGWLHLLHQKHYAKLFSVNKKALYALEQLIDVILSPLFLLLPQLRLPYLVDEKH